MRFITGKHATGKLSKALSYVTMCVVKGWDPNKSKDQRFKNEFRADLRRICPEMLKLDNFKELMKPFCKAFTTGDILEDEDSEGSL